MVRSFKMLVLGFLLLGGQATPPAAEDPTPSGVHLPRPVHTYRDLSISGLPTRLDYYDDPRPFLAFRIDKAPSTSQPAPTLDEEGLMLDRLLSRWHTDYPDPPDPVKFAPDTAALAVALARSLQAPAANWDPTRGTPRHGAPVAALKAELEAVLNSSPIERAFEAHGYRLTLVSIGRIEMSTAPHSPRLPAFISEMNITATRTGAIHGTAP